MAIFYMDDLPFNALVWYLVLVLLTKFREIASNINSHVSLQLAFLFGSTLCDHLLT